jgi:hypothetical protein
MNYMNIVKRSAENAWRYKFLWLFGFFVAITDGGTGTWISEDFKKIREGQYHDLLHLDFLEPAIILFIVGAAITLWLIFWISSVFSEGALIYGIAAKESHGEVTFKQCLSVGYNRFLHLFGIMFLAGLAILFSIIFLLAYIVPAYFASIGVGIALTILAVPVLIAAIIVVTVVEGWSIRYAVLKNMGWLDAIAAGWRLFRDNVGKTLGVAFSSFFAQLVMFLVLLAAVLFLAIPFALVVWVNLWLALIPGLPIAAAIIILANAFFGTFASSVWTIGFMELTSEQVAGERTSDEPIPA